MRTLSTLLAVLLGLQPLAVHAQTAEPLMPRLDTTASVGWFSANHPEAERCCGNWSSSLFKGLGGGYYWTDHLKTELEIAWPGATESSTYTSGASTRPVGGAAPAYIYEEHRYRGTKVSASQVYQFGRNAMFHPFAGAGLDIDREEDAIAQTTQSGNRVSRVDLRETEIHARPFITTGFKAYFSERAFFRTELKVGFSREIEQTVWKSGIGIDFGGSPARRRAVGGATPRGQDAPEVWRAYVTKLPIGSVVKVSTGHSDSFVASLLAVDETGIRLTPHTRIPEPVRDVPFDALERLEPYTHGGPGERAGAIVAGIGAGAGAFFLLLLAVLSQID